MTLNEYLLVFVVEQNSVRISAVMLVVFYRRLGIHMTRHAANRPLREIKTSSTKPEVGLYNVSQHCQNMTEPRAWATCTTNLLKFGNVVFELCERTDEQTDRHTYSSQCIAIIN